jgi:hypothetical protein
VKQIAMRKRSSGRESSCWGNEGTARCMIEGRPRHIDRSAHIFHLPSWLSSDEKVRFVCLRQASDSDFQSPFGADASADGAEDAFLFSMKSLSISPRATAHCAVTNVPLEWHQLWFYHLCISLEDRPVTYHPWSPVLPPHPHHCC